MTQEEAKYFYHGLRQLPRKERDAINEFIEQRPSLTTEEKFGLLRDVTAEVVERDVVLTEKENKRVERAKEYARQYQRDLEEEVKREEKKHQQAKRKDEKRERELQRLRQQWQKERQERKRIKEEKARQLESYTGRRKYKPVASTLTLMEYGDFDVRRDEMTHEPLYIARPSTIYYPAIW